MSAEVRSQPSPLEAVQRIGIGLAFILFPLIFIYAFAAHPGLFHPHLIADGHELVARVHHNGALHLGHSLMLFSVPMLIIVAFQFKGVLESRQASWAGLIGGTLAVLGAVVLAADKGALCLTLSAFDTLPEYEFAALLPGIEALMAKKGWLFVMWGILLLPLGFTIQAIGLIKTRAFSLWQTVPLLIGALLTAMPDGFEIIGVTASIFLAAGLIPIGLRYLGGRDFPNSRSRTPSQHPFFE
jgi:hypothetical protein